MIDAIGNNLETDISTDDAKAFSDYLKKGSSLHIESLTLEGKDLWIPNNKGKEMYYFGLDEDNISEVKETLQSHLELGTTNYGQKKSSYQNQASSGYSH